MPLFESLHRDFAVQGLAVMGVNAREGTGAIRSTRRNWASPSRSSWIR